MNKYIYLTIMIIVSCLIRILPLTLIRKQIKNRFIRSFLYYVPYVTLAVMTFPAILETTKSPMSGYAAFILGIVASWVGVPMFPVSIICCVSVFVLEFFI